MKKVCYSIDGILHFAERGEQNQILNSSLLQKIHEEYIGKIKGIQHVHFAAMEPILACKKVSPSVYVNQASNMNSPPLPCPPLHSSVICLLHVHPNMQELNGLCSKKSDRASKSVQKG
jgi:hypothetical protein